MPPDFNKKTIGTLARRAAFKCSNPDCRVSTVGPNSNIQKSTLIGEAAHIFGARQNAKRYCPNMTNTARAEITNSIWLCRNCHKLIDSDETKYTTDILFAWRELHEKYTQSKLGNHTDRIQFEEQTSSLSLFRNYPPIIRRIVIDKPDGWEFRLTAELMRHINKPVFRKIEDLKDGLYVKPQTYVDDDEVINWVHKRIAERSNLVTPIVGILDRLTKSWGPPGKSGDEREIHHVVCLIRDYLEQVIKSEEEIYFTNVSEEYENIVDLLKNLIGSQATKLRKIPEELDKIVSLIVNGHEGTLEKPLKIEKIITFELPKNWEKRVTREFKRLKRYQNKESGVIENNGCLTLIVGAFVIWILLRIF